MTIKTTFVYSLLVMGSIVGGCRKDNPLVSQTGRPQYTITQFDSSQGCAICHPDQYNEWSGSMHRYASNDPVWRLANNGLQTSTNGRLKSWCFQCHAPIAFLTGTAPQTFQFSDLPPIVREGVNCDFCHILRGPFATTDQNIDYHIVPGRTKYGTIRDPVPNSSHENGYDPAYSRSDVCRPCHDLIINGVPTEVTFMEWQNSPWGAMSVECQDCHMPTYTGRAAVSGPVRNNLHRHDFIGVDVAVTDFPNKPQQRAAVDSLLKNSATVTVDVPATVNVGDSLRIAVTVYNDKTGHNLPTSVFFFRQMWVEVFVWTGSDTLYRSGHLDANGDLKDANSALEPNADRDLVLFGGVLYKHGVETNVFELDSLVNNSIPPFGVRTAVYRMIASRSGVWNVRVRLLFRPFGPYLFRGVGAQEYVAELPTFEMTQYEGTVTVQ